jgi:hypothetical protein
VVLTFVRDCVLIKPSLSMQPQHNFVTINQAISNVPSSALHQSLLPSTMTRSSHTLSTQYFKVCNAKRKRLVL